MQHGLLGLKKYWQRGTRLNRASIKLLEVGKLGHAKKLGCVYIYIYIYTHPNHIYTYICIYIYGNIEILSDLSEKSGCVLYLGALLCTKNYGSVFITQLSEHNHLVTWPLFLYNGNHLWLPCKLPQ